MYDPPFDLDGKVVVLTGGAGLLGAQYTRALSDAGAHVVIADLDGQRAEEVVAGLSGANALACETDITSPRSIQELVESTLSAFGRVGALVNNAALDPKFDSAGEKSHHSAFETYPLDAWNASMAVNVTGAFLCAQAFAPVILESGGGTIVNVSSIYGVVGPDQRLYESADDGPSAIKPPDYSVTKSALLGLTRYLAAYYAGKNLTVNALVIGGVQTDHDAGFVERYSERVPLGRMARPDEYNGALMFMLSESASYLNGASLVADGGWTAW